MKKAFVLAALIVLPFADMALNAKDASTQTIKNLNVAFRGESNAAHKYEIFAQKADKDGYSQVAKMFRAISMAESIHRNNHKAAILELGGKVDVVEFDKVTPLSTKKNIVESLLNDLPEFSKNVFRCVGNTYPFFEV